MSAVTNQPRPTAQAKVLVVEDEPGIAGFIRRGLLFEGYAVEVAVDGKEALAALRDRPPDLLLLDVMIPGIDGYEIARRLRVTEAADGRSPLPVLMLTARDAIPDRITGLDAGADDYLVKPFDFDELLARMRALLRRAKPAEATNADLLQFADLTVEPGSRTVRRGSREMLMTPREFDLLSLLLRHPNQVLTRATIMDRVWGADFYGDSNVLEVYIANLRRSLEADGASRLIQTVRGVGYVLREAVDRSP